MGREGGALFVSTIARKGCAVRRGGGGVVVGGSDVGKAKTHHDLQGAFRILSQADADGRDKSWRQQGFLLFTISGIL